MKRLIPVALLGSLFVVGCNETKKDQAAATPTPPAELTEPQPMPAPTPAPAPSYTPAPEPTPSVTVTPTPAPKPAPKPVAAPKPAPKPATSKTYTVKKGDTLSEIAVANKTTVKRLMELNPSIKTPDRIEAGQKIKLP